jgi:hypothetical protein
MLSVALLLTIVLFTARSQVDNEKKDGGGGGGLQVANSGYINWGRGESGGGIVHVYYPPQALGRSSLRSSIRRDD